MYLKHVGIIPYKFEKKLIILSVLYIGKINAHIFIQYTIALTRIAICDITSFQQEIRGKSTKTSTFISIPSSFE